MREHRELFINGRWVAPSGTGRIDVVNAATEQVMGWVPAGSPEDADRAVRAARGALAAWSATPVERRVAAVSAITEGIGAREDEMAEVISGEVGMPMQFAKIVQVGTPKNTGESMAELASDFRFEERIGNSLVVREPIGVVACITPWNYPLHQIMAKIAPALVAGNTVVLKPSEVAPLNAFLLAEIIEGTELPAGAFNLVSGTGPVIGEALASHPDVGMVSLTGSTRAGRRVAQLGAETVKKVHLELGGKSPNILLDDADFAAMVPDGIFHAYMNSGQNCAAPSRMLVPKARQAEAEAIAKATVESLRFGDPSDLESQFGPLISETQFERVQGYIQKGIDEGATVVVGGVGKPAGLETGYFVKPTVFSDVDNAMTIAQEEIFGPVLCIIGYEDEDDAVRIANDTMYGLSARVCSADPERAQRVARRLQAGQVMVNGGDFNLRAPFGGYKQSGNGRELGRFGLEEFMEIKSMQLADDQAAA